MNAAILSIGTELMTGASVDTNSAWLSGELLRLGVTVRSHSTVGDNWVDITTALVAATCGCELVLVTGGLGPTEDDMTRKALAAALGEELRVDQASLVAIRSFFERIGRSMPQANEVQAMLPPSATPLPNEWGTAPGMRARMEDAEVFCLPGVPREMKAMFAAYVEPFARSRPDRQAMAVRAIHTFGAGESHVAEMLGDMMAPGRNPAVGTTASEGVITVRIVAEARSQAEADELADRDASTVRATLGRLVWGEGGDTLAGVVGHELARRRFTLSTAESCTGGLLSTLLTDVPGSSQYYLGGFVTYCNARKMTDLGIDPALIERCGAVSEEVARAMASGCRRVTGSDYALSLTGIAGPTGGTPDKPLGLVYIGLAGPTDIQVTQCRFSDRLDRRAIRDRSAKTALNLLRLDLKV